MAQGLVFIGQSLQKANGGYPPRRSMAHLSGIVQVVWHSLAVVDIFGQVPQQADAQHDGNSGGSH